MTVQEIKDYMKTNKIGYATLSEKSGVPIGTLKSIFSFRTPTPRIDTMQAIENALGLTSDAQPIPIYVQKLRDNMSNSELTLEECEKLQDFLKYIVSKREQR